MLKHKSTSLITYNIYAIVLSNTTINVQQDRLYHRVLGHAHSSWLLSSRVSQLGMLGTQLDTPPYNMHATGSTSAHAWNAWSGAGAIPRNPRIPTHAHTAQESPPKEGVASLGAFCSEQDQNVIEITR